MNINSINYEVYALEYLEGTLPAEVKEEMDLFLAKHPAIASELAMLQDLPILEKEEVIYPHKKDLLKRSKKESILLPFYWKLAATAAILLLLSTVYFRIFMKQQTSSQVPLAIEEKLEQPSFHTMSLEEEKTPSMIVQANNNNQKKDLKEPSNQIVQLSNNATYLQKPKLKSAIPPPIQDHIQEPIIEQKSILPMNKQAQEVAYVPTKKVHSIQALPRIGIQELDHNRPPLILPTKQLFQQSMEGIFASNTPPKRTLKSLLGKLPGKVGKAVFIPTFFTDESAGQ